MKLMILVWKIVGFLLIILGIISILAIHNWLSGFSITMPEEALTYIPPFAGYICCGIVILIGIITLVGWFWTRHPKTIYTLSLLIGLASIVGCYLTHNDNAFKVAISMLSMSIVIITILTMLLETFSARNISKHWRIVISSCFIAVYLIPMLGFVFPQCFDAVALSFPDPVLRQAVRNEVGTPFGFRTQTDLKRIRHLSAGDWGDQSSITQLKGLEKCTGLEELQLNVDYEPADISPLSNLTNLKRLQITHFFQLNDITPLSNLRQLTYLCLDFNGITDISSLSNLTNLSVLVLSNDGIIDISPISNLDNLSVLELSGSGIKDISPLAGLTNLTELNLYSNQIEDISTLSSLSKLTRLTLSDNPFSDITPVVQLTQLNYLNIILSNVSDISPLLNNTGLGLGDEVLLTEDDLANWNDTAHIDNYSRTVVIPELRARGITVDW
jgi:hypothetical protein